MSRVRDKEAHLGPTSQCNPYFSKSKGKGEIGQGLKSKGGRGNRPWTEQKSQVVWGKQARDYNLNMLFVKNKLIGQGYSTVNSKVY